MEKEKLELEAIKNLVTSIQSKPVQDERALEELVKSMASLKFIDEEMDKLKANIVQKDTQIIALKETIVKRKLDLKEAMDSNN